MRKRRIMPLSVALFGLAAAGSASQAFEVVPREFDPGRTFLIQAEWLAGIRCPTNATIALANADISLPPHPPGREPIGAG
jgi:hypothetical protein